MSKLVSIVLSLLFLLKIRRVLNFHEHICNNYGWDTAKVVRKLESSSKKFVKCEMDISFLNSCAAHNVIPKFLKFKLYKKTLLSGAFYRKWQEELLLSELKDKKSSLASIGRQVTDLKSELKNTLSPIDFLIGNRNIHEKMDKFRTHTSETHTRKLNNLGVESMVKPCDPNRVVYNFSSANLPFRVKYLLAFGLEFSLPIFSLNFHEYFLPFEKLIAYVKGSSTPHPEFLSKVRTCANHYFFKFKGNQIFSPAFDGNDFKLLKSFSRNEDVIVCPPDKGRGVVILNKTDYTNSMEKLLNCPQFEVLTHSIKKFSLKLEDKVNNFLRKLKGLQSISNECYQSLYVRGSGPGVLYGTPKIHKDDFASKFQLRPIFAAYNTASYKISKYLVPILKPLTTGDYTVQDSAQFVDKISNFHKSSDTIMASFDVENLFTNIPLDETIDICIKKFFPSDNSTIMGLSQQYFREFLDLAVKNTFFLFNGKIYQQRDGVGMGLPLGPTFANIFMTHHESIWLEQCPVEFRPIFYKRYVDDIFLLFNHHTHITKFHEYLNRQHPSIKFTTEVEREGRLAFLDCMVTRGETGFQCGVFRKKTFSGLGTSFYSFIPTTFKINAIRTLLNRAYRVCTSYSLLHSEFEYLRKYFVENGYTASIIDREIRKFLDALYQTPMAGDKNTTDYKYLSIPYFGRKSTKLKREILELVKKYYPDFSLKIILHNKFKIVNFFPYKDRLPMEAQSSLVYNFCCASCNASYVGMTSRTLSARIAEHIGVSLRTGVPLLTPPHSSIRDHTEKCGSDISLDNFKIIKKSNSDFSLKILESLFIYTLSPKLNAMNSSYPLSIVSK